MFCECKNIWKLEFLSALLHLYGNRHLVLVGYFSVSVFHCQQCQHVIPYRYTASTYDVSYITFISSHLMYTMITTFSDDWNVSAIWITFIFKQKHFLFCSVGNCHGNTVLPTKSGHIMFQRNIYQMLYEKTVGHF